MIEVKKDGPTRIFHDPGLEPGQWAVDGDLQDGELTEEALDAALGEKPRRVTCGDAQAMRALTGMTPGSLAQPEGSDA